MRRLLFTICFFVSFFLRFAVPAWANEEFQTFYLSKYTVLEDGLVVVDQEINFKNRLANIFISEYSLTIGSNRVSHIAVWDDFGSLDPKVEVGQNKTKISVKFTHKVVGKDKEIRLHIRYQTSDFATINGQILEVSIPSIANKEELDDYKVELVVPSVFGPPSFLQPRPDEKILADEQTIYQFNKDSLFKVQGVSAAFGEMQIYDFTFFYHLKNAHNFKSFAKITLPADTSLQRAYYESIEPAPYEIEVDEDENWLALYKLNPKEELTVVASGSAEIYIRAKEELKTKPLSTEELEKYLQAADYWEVDDEKIVNLAQELKTVEKIYDYVVSNLIYDYGRLEGDFQRLGAKRTLEHKQSALCTEFTDLFITLSRAAGIPAREVNGFAYTANPKLRPLSLTQDILHAWPEFYDSKTNLWIPVDPTWENTTGGVDFFHKLDLNHFAFVRHGLKSDSPLPAGAYNSNLTEEKADSGQGQKNVFVEFGNKKEYPESFEFKANLPSSVIAGLPIKGEIFVANNGQSAYHQKSLKLTTHQTQEFKIDVLPPKASYRAAVFLETTWSKSKNYNIQVSFGNKSIGYQIRALSFYQYFWEQLQQWLRNLTRFDKIRKR